MIATLDSIQAALLAATDVEGEVIVVDNGSTDGTSSAVEQWIRSAMVPASLVFESQPGLSRARNTAIRKAKGDVLVFTDDDCTLQADYIAKLVACYRADDVPVIRGGRVDLGDAQDLPFTIKTDSAPQTFTETTHPGTFILGCNMAMSRSVVELVGDFDEDLGAGTSLFAAEEADYFVRAHRKGVQIHYAPELRVSHFHGRRQPSEIARLSKGYHIGTGALYAKHLFSRSRLLRHFWWDCKQAVKEVLGGPTLHSDMKMTYRSLLVDNLVGMLRYTRIKIARLASRG